MYWYEFPRMLYFRSSSIISLSNTFRKRYLRSSLQERSQRLRQQWQLQLFPSRGKSIHSGCPNQFPMKQRYPSPPRLKEMRRIILCRAIPRNTRGVSSLKILILVYISASNSHMEIVLSPTRAWSWLQAYAMQGYLYLLFVSWNAMSPTFQFQSFSLFNSLIHMSGTAIANLNPKPIPPSSMGRQSPGNPETSSAMSITWGYMSLASILAIERQASASTSSIWLKYSPQFPVKPQSLPWWEYSMEVTPSNLKPSALYYYSQKRILERRNRKTSYLEQSKTLLSHRG